MIIYIAGRSIEQAKEVREIIQSYGHTCNARWIDLADPQKFGKGYKYTKEERVNQAITCFTDVHRCDMLLHLANTDYVGKGGRHFEAGLAIGLGKRVVHVGPPENVFHWLPLLYTCADIEELKLFFAVL